MKKTVLMGFLFGIFAVIAMAVTTVSIPQTYAQSGNKVTNEFLPVSDITDSTFCGPEGVKEVR